MRTRNRPTERSFDQGLTWLSLGYGIFCAAVYANYTHDELEIAFGVEMIIISLLDFMWARARRSLGIGLIVAGVAAPVMGLGSAPLFWQDAQLFSGDGFFTPLIVGIIGGAPLVWLGFRTLKHGAVTPPTPDPQWLKPVRWALRAGLWLIVLAFRLGDFRSGTVLVYLGAALALCSLALGLPRRLNMGKGGVGKLLAFIGASALLITLAAGVAVGGHMSRDEQMLGIVPSLLLIVVGGIVAWRSGREPSAASRTGSKKGMTMEFHLKAKDRARHETSLKPESSIEIEITQSVASGLAQQGGSFELELYRRNQVSQEWELVGTATAGIGSRVRSVFESLESGAEYTLGIFYKPYGDAIDSELSVDGNITVR